MQKIGTKKEVFQGTAVQTSGGLKKEDLMKNKKGKIVSKKQHENGLKALPNIASYSIPKKPSK